MFRAIPCWRGFTWSWGKSGRAQSLYGTKDWRNQFRISRIGTRKITKDLRNARDQVLVDNTAQSVFKHLDRIEDNRAVLGVRWIWELLQNARDAASTDGVCSPRNLSHWRKLLNSSHEEMQEALTLVGWNSRQRAWHRLSGRRSASPGRPSKTGYGSISTALRGQPYS